METVAIYSIGKSKEIWLQLGFDEYVKRLKPRVAIETFWCKNDLQLISLVQKKEVIVGLDMQGKSLNSEQFAAFYFMQMQRGKNRLSLVIGGPEGLPETLKKNLLLISFSSMTFTHQMMRLLLIEQIYRSYEIARGSPYHK